MRLLTLTLAAVLVAAPVQVQLEESVPVITQVPIALQMQIDGMNLEPLDPRPKPRGCTRFRRGSRLKQVCQIRKVFGPRAGAAIRVATCESNLNPYARNQHSDAAGLFQFVPGHWRGRWNPYNGWVNTVHAYWLSHHGTNWQAWNASRGCWA